MPQINTYAVKEKDMGHKGGQRLYHDACIFKCLINTILINTIFINTTHNLHQI